MEAGVNEARRDGSFEAHQKKSGFVSAFSHSADHDDRCFATPYTTQRTSLMSRNSVYH
jgi:hypothetical protein